MRRRQHLGMPAEHERRRVVGGRAADIERRAGDPVLVERALEIVLVDEASTGRDLLADLAADLRPDSLGPGGGERLDREAAVGSRPVNSSTCCRASSPITRWKSRTMEGNGCGPATVPMM